MILTPTHPLWLAGFRPFFLLAFVSGATLPVGWLLILFGVWPAPDSAAGSAVVWHAHEMFYGFGWAMLGGFLLTASKNWVKGRGVHGRTLMFLTLAWLFDRLAMGFGAAWPAPLFLVASQLFLITIVALLVWALARHHRQDAYPDNLYFILALPLFPLAKWLLLQPGTFALGLSMTIGLFRLAFLLMLERTLPPFMQRAFRIVLPRNHWLDGAIRLLGFVLIFERLLPPPLAGGL
ncbi:MAG: NnrS family protein, partial [Gammaproteobacteria bacterium]|nr:NnrS family protein [Gammaproteobacteria bacterium]